MTIDARPRPRLLVRRVQVREEVLLGTHAHVVHAGAGEDRAPDVDRVRRARHERGVARADAASTSGARSPPWRRSWSTTSVSRSSVDAELALVEVGDRHRAASGCPCSSSSGGCAGCAPPRRASRPRSSGDGMSGLPNAEVDRRPRRLAGAAIFSASICGERVRRQRVDAAELHMPSTVRAGRSTSGTSNDPAHSRARRVSWRSRCCRYGRFGLSRRHRRRPRRRRRSRGTDRTPSGGSVPARTADAGGSR